MAEEFQPDYYVQKRTRESPASMSMYGWWAICLGFIALVLRMLTPLNTPVLAIALFILLGILLLNIEKLMKVNLRAPR